MTGPDALGQVAPATGLRLDWDAADRAQWQAWTAEAGRSSLEQAWAYGSAVAAAQNCQVRRGVVRHGDTPLALFQVFAKYAFLPLRWHQALRGPVLLPAATGAEEAVLRAIKAAFRLRDRRLLLWMPELPDGAANDALLRRCGWRRMTTGYSTAWIDLKRPAAELRAALHGKWRNALVAAEAGGLRCDVAGGGRRLAWLIQGYEGYRRKKTFVGPDRALVEAPAEAAGPNELTVLTALRGNTPQAAILLLRHGAAATYYLSYTTPEGRAAKAHNLLLWRGLLTLQERGVQWFDLGGVNAAAPGVARFKLGLGGEFITLAGSYL